jgi:CheY-like chemotaxis protein
MTTAHMDEYILVVEDDQALREGLSDALLLEGYRVESAENGQTALRILKKGVRPCLILLDLMMPVMDGWTFRQELLKDPALSDIPVVVMTAASMQAARGVATHKTLWKPLQMDAVVDVVLQHCPPPTV